LHQGRQRQDPLARRGDQDGRRSRGQLHDDAAQCDEDRELHVPNRHLSGPGEALAGPVPRLRARPAGKLTENLRGKGEDMTGEMSMKRAASFHLTVAMLCALVLTALPARAEVGEVRIGRQPGLPFLPLMVMEHFKFLEKHAAAAGMPELKATY